MAKSSHGKSIWLLVGIAILVIDGAAGNANLLDTKRWRLVKQFKNPAAVKTIKSEDGDIIDCVDIYMQPAFDHPALRNHTIQMRPSDHTEETESNTSSIALAQLLRVEGSCPEGTIPILRTRKNDLRRANSPERFDTKAVYRDVQRAVVMMMGTFYGASAYLNVWELHVEPQDDSSSSVILGKKSSSGDNLIVAGWTVSKQLYGDQKTRLTIYWTADGSRATGCHNHNCPGFVQTNSQIPLGAVFSSNSVYGGDLREISVTIYLDRQSNHWWLKYYDVPVGYWPSSIFKDLSTAAIVNWGGEVGIAASGGPHSATQMGNGHYPSEGFRKSAYMSKVLYRGADNQDHQPDGGFFWMDRPYCYDMEAVGMGDFGRPGYTFFFGGSGRGDRCI